jgi:tRNA pseudouridine55 synthase
MQIQPARPVRRRVDGVLLLDKPVGMTSNAALQAARRVFGALKAGHTGTLDPLASGLLPLCFGEATKFAQSLLDSDKSYEAVVRLGIVTDSGDADGRVMQTRPVGDAADRLEPVLERFRGAIEQIPPMHSALKREGVPLYVLARKGIEVARAPRGVTIMELRGERLDGDRVMLLTRCSKGTYVRVLAQDIGEALGCGAHLEALRRTAIGALDVCEAIALSELEDTDPTGRDALLRPVDALLARWPRVDLAEQAAGEFRCGRIVAADLPAGDDCWRVYAAGAFLGLGRQVPGGGLAPKRLLATDAAAANRSLTT